MTASGLSLGYDSNRSPKIEDRTIPTTPRSKGKEQKGSITMDSNESLLAQALEVPSLLYHQDGKDGDDTSSTCNGSIQRQSLSPGSTPQTSYTFTPQSAVHQGGVVLDSTTSAANRSTSTTGDSTSSAGAASGNNEAIPSILPLHSDFTVPTSNLLRYESDVTTLPHSNMIGHRRNSSITTQSRGADFSSFSSSFSALRKVVVDSPPRNLLTTRKSPSQQQSQCKQSTPSRRTIMGSNAKTRYHVRREASIAKLTPPSRRQESQLTRQHEQYQQHQKEEPDQLMAASIPQLSSGLSAPLTPTRRTKTQQGKNDDDDYACTPSRLLDIHAAEPPALSPLTPFDRRRRRTDPMFISDLTDPNSDGLNVDDDKDLMKPRQIHETIHAQSLLIGLAFLWIWTPNNIMAPNLTQMAETTFDMTPEQRDLYLGSYCALAVGVFSLPISALIGFMVDFYPRKHLFVLCVLGASIATAWTAGSTTFASLFLARVVTGGCMSASVPVAFSLLGDLFAAEERNAASSGLSAMMGCGILVGQVYSGIVGPSLGWTHPFVVSGVLNLVSAIAVAIWVQEPDRGAKEKVLQALIENGNKYERKLTWQGFVHAMQTNMSNKMLLWQGFFTSLPWGIVFVFLNDFLSQEKGFSVPDATFMVMLFGIGSAIGGIGGGYIGQILQQYNRSYVPLFMAVATFCGIFPFVGLLNSEFPNHHGYKAMLYSVVAGTIASLPAVCVRPCILNVNPPETRGAALTAANLLVALGRGIGPSCITLLGSMFDVSRHAAFNFTLIVFWTITAIQLLFLAKYLPQDQDDMEAELAQYAATQSGNGSSERLLDGDDEDSGTEWYQRNPQAELTPLEPPHLPNISKKSNRPRSSNALSMEGNHLRLLDDDETLMSMEEYIANFDGQAARRSFKIMRQGIREIKDEMACLTCGSANSSEEEDKVDDDDDIVERRKEAWTRQRNNFASINSTDTTDHGANQKGVSDKTAVANETTPLMLV